jgi:hypothetical protein
MENMSARQSRNACLQVISKDSEYIRSACVRDETWFHRTNTIPRMHTTINTYSSRQMQHSRLLGSTRSSGATTTVGSCRIARLLAGGFRRLSGGSCCCCCCGTPCCCLAFRKKSAALRPNIPIKGKASFMVLWYKDVERRREGLLLHERRPSPLSSRALQCFEEISLKLKRPPVWKCFARALGLCMKYDKLIFKMAPRVVEADVTSGSP